MAVISLISVATRCALRRKIGLRSFCSQANVSKIRNIGIIAHIDAGKTTTTERMLFYSGFTPTMGEVHDGDTITDYMPQERERGITITSATISFQWNKHKINLIDTPGHVDFTVEVERSLRVLDGAVTVLDASAGVEAQTLTVWKQADRYRTPRMIYLNKMDKPKANFDLCLKDIEDKLHLKPLICQIPSINPKTNQFCGVFDVVSMTELVWNTFDNSKGSSYTVVPLERSRMREIALKKRAELIESLGALDDAFAERFVLSDEEPTKEDIQDALRKVTTANIGVPLFCGSSYKNIGVQPLLDSIVDYFPDPTHSVPEEVTKYFKETDTVALAFKILHTKYRGPLTFVRVYSGTLQPGKKIHIMNRDITEKCGELLEANADEYIPMKSAGVGSIVAVCGLKETITGDTLVGSSSEASHAAHKAKDESALLFGISPMEPVFQCSIEPPSLRHQKQLEHALQCLQREDPSLQVVVDPDTGQTVISGMGSLQLEIIKDRIKREYDVDPYMGPLQISYRETPQKNIDNLTITVDRVLGGTKQYVEINCSICKTAANDQKPFVVQCTEDNGLKQLKAHHRKALENGVRLSLAHGPLLGFPVVNSQVVLTHFVTTYSTGLSMITATMSQCITKGLRQASAEAAIDLLEPFMRLEISVPSSYVGSTLSDLSRRRALIEGVKQAGDTRIVNAVCPLADLTRYSTDLRTLTSGRAVFTMEIDSYKVMNAAEKADALRKASGFS